VLFRLLLRTYARLYIYKSCVEHYKHSLTFRVRRCVVIATKPVHRLQIRPIVHNHRRHPIITYNYSLTITPNLHPGPCSSVGMRRGTDRRTDRQTDTQTQTAVTTVHFASAAPHAQCNDVAAAGFEGLAGQSSTGARRYRHRSENEPIHHSFQRWQQQAYRTVRRRRSDQVRMAARYRQLIHFRSSSAVCITRAQQ